MKQKIEQIICELTNWAAKLRSEIGVDGAFVFGSLIRSNGAQFTSDSDVDLILIMPSNKNGIWERADWIRALRPHIQELEGTLIKTLQRNNAGKPITSVVAVTKYEIRTNTHKDKKTEFFSENQFYDLLKSVPLTALPEAGSAGEIHKKVFDCFAFTQKIRNEFLSISMNGNLRMPVTFDDPVDPLPKHIMRQAAIMRQLETPSKKPDAETDVARGLEFVSNFLYGKEETNEDYADLYEVVSVRRNARGERKPLSAFHQLFIAEMIFTAAGRFEFARREKEKENEKADSRGRPKLGEHSTVFFSDRFSRAFPGIRKTTWYDEPNDIARRLALLFAEPLDYSNAQPIWWWRDGNLPITSFKRIDGNIFMRNEDEMRISRIAAIYNSSYKALFVYFEIDPMEPTGLYQSTFEYLKKPDNDGLHPYYWEEYGLVDGKTMVTRSELDDGSAEIDGEIVRIVGRTQGRVRYVTKYNFVVAASDAPLGNQKFDRILVEYLDGILLGTHKLEGLEDVVRRLPSPF